MPINVVNIPLNFGPMTRLDKSAVKYLVVHTEGAPGNADGSALSIHTYHRLARSRGGRGWSGIGYHFVIRKSGRVERGRPLDRQGAHVEGVNRLGIGICCSGHGDLADFTREQKRSLAGLLRDLQREFPGTTVEGHRPLVDRLIAARKLDPGFRTGKTCPGGRVNVAELQQLVGLNVPAPPQPGDRRWSNYFKEWIILTRYESDSEWYFVRASRLNDPPTRAHARWSQVPMVPPVD